MKPNGNFARLDQVKGYLANLLGLGGHGKNTHRRTTAAAHHGIRLAHLGGPLGFSGGGGGNARR